MGADADDAVEVERHPSPPSGARSRNGELTNLLVGNREQITSNLIELERAGMTMPLIWPQFADVPTSKTLEDLRVLNDEILPTVDAA